MLKNLNWKKILLLIGFICLIIIFTYGLYYFFFRQILPTSQINKNISNANQRLPTIGQGNLNIFLQNLNTGLPVLSNISPEKISKIARGDLTLTTKLDAREVLANSLLAKGNEIYYYDRLDGKFYRVTKDGQKQLLKDRAFYDVQKVNWSPKGDQAILEYPDGSNILYNFNTGQQTTLLKELSDFAFDQGGNRISSELVTNNKDSNWLVTANPDGSGMKYIEPLADKANDVQTAWSADNQIIAIYREGIDIGRQEIFPLGQNNENFPSLVVEGRGFEGKWSPTDNTLIYSVYNQNSSYRPVLYVAKTGASGTSAVFNTGLSTWSNKCTFGSSKAYCGVPINLPENSGLVPQLAQASVYGFYEIDLNSGNSQFIATPVGSNGTFYNVSNVTLSADGKYLYFTDYYSNELYSIQLQ